MAFNPTPEQHSAIFAKGNILVSAAAGSGKTAVLVERVIQKLCSPDECVSADSLLIVTFTNAAAAEMRSRIEMRLDEECRKHPDDVSLLRQKHLLSSAKICTIDSFCIDLVRENFEIAGVSPDFKISDGNSLKAINERVLSSIVNRHLKENTPYFEELLDIVGTEYDETSFVEFVLGIYEYSRQLPFPEIWFNEIAEFYSQGVFSNESPWYVYAFGRASEVIDECVGALSCAIDLLSVCEKASEVMMPQFLQAKEYLNILTNALDTGDWDIFYYALVDFYLPSLPVVRGVSSIYEVTAAKNIYKYISDKAIDKLKKIFYADLSVINGQFSMLSKPIALLADILTEFDTALFEEYTSLNTFTFHNTEHLALRLLCEQREGEIIVKPQAEKLLNRFSEVMVDEYQDTNDLQDMLFYVLSNRESRLFVVGDVKQSIYGFRGANPRNFLKKKNRYIPFAEAKTGNPQKIILGNNFRCKPQVCDFVNFFFTLFMNPDTGEIVYNEEEKLIPAAVYPEIPNEISTDFYILNSKATASKNNLLEARLIADYIHKVMNSGPVIKVDNENLRPARFSDFAILLRSAKLKAPAMAEELKKQGIPVSFTLENFTQTIEISTFLSLLTVIDNPQRDIELLSVMLSPIFGFTPDDVSNFRIEKRDASLYSAVVLAGAQGKEAAKSFLKQIEKYRLYSVTNPLPRFISLLLNETNYIDIVSVMPDGAKRRYNLLLLCDYAEQYIKNSSPTLGGFIRFISKQSEGGLKAASVGGGSDSVKIMSIHASKGLQFPVCIVAGLSADFNDNEAHSATLYSTDFGIGFKYFDEVEKKKLTTVGREVILDRIRRTRLEEELRLFYVALTRTQDRLLMTATFSDVEKKVEEIKTLLISSGCSVTSNLFSRTKSYADWLLISLLLHPDGKCIRGNGSSIITVDTKSKIAVSVFDAESLPDRSETKGKAKLCEDKTLTDKIKNNISFVYPFEKLLNIESKASVSRLANSAESAKYAFSGKPSFMSVGGITASERGTAMHRVMQFFDFENFEQPELEIERLYEWQFISEREAKAMDIKALKSFFGSEIFSRIRQSQTVKREMRFLTEVPAGQLSAELENELSDEKIIVQGAVDVCFIEPDGIVILDFKTDRVDSPLQLAAAYSEQLNIYAAACEKIFEKPVKQKIIYSFALSREIEVK
ncbi:MAG: helicase-exonuclease AddAB subunit AddA [Clostridia bacterium]|nr:helicase-exonuclease AddAB subunit AddA [Clostridia bacterium]